MHKITISLVFGALAPSIEFQLLAYKHNITEDQLKVFQKSVDDATDLWLRGFVTEKEVWNIRRRILKRIAIHVSK